MKMLHSLFVIAYFVVLLSGCVSTNTKPSDDLAKEAEYYYKMGISSLNEGNVKMAYVQLHKAYDLDPNNKDILNSLGVVFMQLAEDDKALSFFKRVIELDKRYSEAYNNIGVIYLRRGNYSDAIDAFNRALSNPLYQFPERAYYNLGVAYYKTKRYDDAIRSFQSSVMLTPDFVMSYYGLALALNKKGDYGSASLALHKAIALDQKYKGNVEAYRKDLKNRALHSRGEDLIDINDYLEILNY